MISMYLCSELVAIVSKTSLYMWATDLSLLIIQGCMYVCS